MDYKDFVTKKDGYTGFVQIRNTMNDMLENPEKYNKSFDDLFTEVGALAMDNNSIAQDIMSYYYKEGVPGHVAKNYDLYMKWGILSAANGNEFAIEKLQFFLNYAFSQIIFNEKLPEIIEKNDITEKNYLYIIGNLLCEGLVDELKITAKGLVESPQLEVSYTPERLRIYKRELEKALPKVLDYLLS